MGTEDWFGLGGFNSLPRGFSGLDLGWKQREDSRMLLFLPRAKAFPVPHPALPVRGWGCSRKGERHTWDR